MKRLPKFLIYLLWYAVMKLFHIIRHNVNAEYRAESDKKEMSVKLLKTCESIIEGRD